MTPRPLTATMAAVASAAVLLSLAACVPNNPTSESGTNALTVTSSATDCAVSASEAPSGSVSFTVSNTTDEVTEFYVLAEDSLRIVGEVENIGPGIERDLVIQARPGTYYTVCKPGMIGDGIGKAEFTVTDSGDELAESGDDAEAVALAAANYVAYVKNQVE